MKDQKSLTRDITIIGLMSAITVIMAQISIPMPLGVPMTMQTFAVTLVAVVLGAKRSAISMGIYLLLGAIGLPVFASFNGGLQVLVGPTGGFLLSFPLMAFVIGYGVRYRRKKKGMFTLFLILGTALNYAVGLVMFCLLMKASLITGLMACVVPFIPTAIIKAILGSWLGFKIKDRVKITSALV